MTQQSALYQKEPEFANQPPRRLRWILAGVLLLLVLAAGIYSVWGRPENQPYVTVRRGALRGTVIASGEVASARQAQLSSRVAGQVSWVQVEAGSGVVSGTLLLAIEAESLNFRVEQSQLRLEIARLRLAEAVEGTPPEDIAVAEAELTLAEAQLAALQSGAGVEDAAVLQQEVVQAQAALERARQAGAISLEEARLNWETAANALRDAQDAYGRIDSAHDDLRQRGISLSQVQVDAKVTAGQRLERAEAALERARLAYEQALQEQQAGVGMAAARLARASARLQDAFSGPSAAALAAALAQVARAEAALARAQNGTSPRGLQVLEQEVGLAELSLEEAQYDLSKAMVRAPFSGTVVDVQADEGELVGLYSPLVTLADLGQLQIEARIDEIDVGQVAPGQMVTITLDAFPGQSLPGYVKEVAPAVTVERGSPVYLSTIAFASPPTMTLRLGMAASLVIVTVEKQDVLLLPRQAVERVGNGYYVTVRRGRNQERIPVILGLADARHYEVIEGLVEGERVLLP